MRIAPLSPTVDIEKVISVLVSCIPNFDLVEVKVSADYYGDLKSFVYSAPEQLDSYFRRYLNFFDFF